MEMLQASLDELLAADHRARIVWRYVQALDTDTLYKSFKPTALGKGRPAIAPEILLAVWLMATIDGINSSRELARRCKSDIAYRWLCGGVSVNYHTLSDFRSGNVSFFEKMLVTSITSMLQEGFVTLDTLGQDGMRVRASAGKSSFRRQPTLKEHYEQARKRVKQQREELDDDEQRCAANARREASRKRAAEELESRIGQSLIEVEELARQKEKRQKGDGKKARCSPTDPEARVMKMGDGGFRPALDVQFVTDADTRTIVGVDVNNSGSDRGKMAPMYEKLINDYGVVPNKYVVDSAFATHADVAILEQRGTAIYSTVKGAAKKKAAGEDPYAPNPKDTTEFAKFRARMRTEEAQKIYSSRPSISEFPNAEFRNRGGTHFLVRGIAKAKSVALLFANTFNLMRMMHLELI